MKWQVQSPSSVGGGGLGVVYKATGALAEVETGRGKEFSAAC